MTTSHIRLITKKDLQQVFKTFAIEPYNKPLKLFEDYYLEQEKGLREVYLALMDTQIIAYVTLVWDSPYSYFAEAKIPEIKDLNVLVEYRCQGHGTSMIKHIELRLYEAGYTTVGIGAGITPDYDAARRLYPTLGYISDGRGIHPDEEGGTIYFTKNLNHSNFEP